MDGQAKLTVSQVVYGYYGRLAADILSVYSDDVCLEGFIKFARFRTAQIMLHSFLYWAIPVKAHTTTVEENTSIFHTGSVCIRLFQLKSMHPL